MKKLFSFLFLFISITVIAQDKSQPAKKTTKAGFGVTVTQVQPEFPGGADSLQSFLKNNLAYPDSAKINHIQGKVYIGFLIDYEGKIKNPRILSSASPDLDKEAMRVVSMMPDWKPGTAGGSPVSVQYILPIEFITPPAVTKP
jgi:TonB family protein